ncbi:MAG: ParM/StbA family protein [Clostridium beijerinckii]|jgi:plasmid segregation protein ParM|nr:ParM/StbA family protein [Clostridium beijerinckii]MCI1578939.1 ParM/StbA family protein [Clostridium beijerinckii]MCI1624444.1 ParM/StbA family protein [Clostridium beijerinckii]
MENRIENKVEIEKNNSEIRITNLDLGNMNIKYNGQAGNGIFPSKISTDSKPYEEGFQRIELDGRKTYIGVGEISREFSKAERDYVPQLLYGICKANSDIDIIQTNLSLLLPSLQMPNKNKLIETLKNKEFSFKFNGKDRIVSIKDLLILPEGYVSYFDLSEEERRQDLCIIEVGSRTINITTIIEGKIETMNTVKYGSLDFFTKIKNIEAGKGEDYVEEDIERLIKRGTIKVTKKSYEEFLSDILNYVKAYVNIKNYNTWFSGGTSLMLKPYIEEKCKECKLFANPLTSNLNGSIVASKKLWSNING